MFKKFFLIALLSFSFSSCMTYLKNVNHDSKLVISEKYKSEKLKIYFSNETEADLQNVELFREMILNKNMFQEVLLVRSEKIETCEGYCILLKNTKSSLSVTEKLNMAATFLTVGIIPSRFTNEYTIKNKNRKTEEIEIVNWVSIFLAFYVANDTYQDSETDQLIKLQTLLN